MKNYINKDWQEFFKKSPKLSQLEEIMTEVKNIEAQGNIIYPPEESIFNAFNCMSPDDVRVVILGQDPYHEPMQANGLAFSVNEGVKLPPSLKNIFKELQSDLGGELRTNGDLSDWASQGVLLLNSALTVIEHNANSMAKLWAGFTDEIVIGLNELEHPVIFVLWGNNSRDKAGYITNPIHHIIESAHPSPLSARRGFFGSKPFSRINEYLTADGYKEIIWG